MFIIRGIQSKFWVILPVFFLFKFVLHRVMMRIPLLYYVAYLFLYIIARLAQSVGYRRFKLEVVISNPTVDNISCFFF